MHLRRAETKLLRGAVISDYMLRCIAHDVCLLDVVRREIRAELDFAHKPGTTPGLFVFPLICGGCQVSDTKHQFTARFPQPIAAREL